MSVTASRQLASGMSARPVRRLLLVGWDAADRQSLFPLIEKDALPSLSWLITTGVHGEVAPLSPPTAPLLWTSLVTGQPADRHGIASFTEPDPDTGCPRPVSLARRKTSALWDHIPAEDGGATVINLPASYPAERTSGVFVADTFTPFPLKDGRVPLPSLPRTVASSEPADRDSLESLRMGSGEIAARIVAAFDEGLSANPDLRQRQIAQITFLLADCFTTHNAATFALAERSWKLAIVRYPGPEPFYRIAEMLGADDPAAVRNHPLVENAFRLHDLFLRRLMELAASESDTAVVFVAPGGLSPLPQSPLGFTEREAALPRPGFFAFSGPGIAAGEQLTGVRLQDFFPTILSYLGYPVPTGVSGRIIDAFVKEFLVARSASSTVRPAPAPQDLPCPQEDAVRLQQMAARGDVASLSGNDFLNAKHVRERWLWNHARALSHAEIPARSVPILETLHRLAPERSEVSLLLAEEWIALGRTTEADALLTPLALEPQLPLARLLRGIIAVREKRREEAEKLLGALLNDPMAVTATLKVRLGHLLFQLRRVEWARLAFEQATALSPEEPLGWLGQATCALRRHRYADAEMLVRRSLALHHDQQLAHLILARTLIARGDEEGAIDAYLNTIEIAPTNNLAIYAHRMLARLYTVYPNCKGQAAHHRARVRQLRGWTFVDNSAATASAAGETASGSKTVRVGSAGTAVRRDVIPWGAVPVAPYSVSLDNGRSNWRDR